MIKILLQLYRLLHGKCAPTVFTSFLIQRRVDKYRAEHFVYFTLIEIFTSNFLKKWLAFSFSKTRNLFILQVVQALHRFFKSLNISRTECLPLYLFITQRLNCLCFFLLSLPKFLSYFFKLPEILCCQ